MPFKEHDYIKENPDKNSDVRNDEILPWSHETGERIRESFSVGAAFKMLVMPRSHIKSIYAMHLDYATVHTFGIILNIRFTFLMKGRGNVLQPLFYRDVPFLACREGAYRQLCPTHCRMALRMSIMRRSEVNHRPWTYPSTTGEQAMSIFKCTGCGNDLLKKPCKCPKKLDDLKRPYTTPPDPWTQESPYFYEDSNEFSNCFTADKS